MLSAGIFQPLSMLISSRKLGVPSCRSGPMASTAKMMTALLVVDNADLAEVVTISRRAQATGHKQVWLRRGDQWTVGELLEALIVVSANDAAVALAEHVGGDVGSFVDMMNERAAELGLADTVYVNPHGLDATGQHTTAGDLLIVGREVMARPMLAELAARQEAVLVKGDGSTRRWDSTNELLGSYQGAVGIKTGWTSRAGDMLVAAAERDGRRIYAVVMGSRDANADAAALLDHGFAVLACSERRLVAPMGDQQESPAVRVVHSTGEDMSQLRRQ